MPAASGRAHRVLFLCTGNSARSILAESLLRQLGGSRFEAASAGSRPRGRVHPLAIELLERKGLPTTGLRSKGWDEFAALAERFDTVITVCDAAAAESCPVAAARSKLHWSIPDPAAAGGTDAERRRAFEAAYLDLEARIRELVRTATA